MAQWTITEDRIDGGQSMGTIGPRSAKLSNDQIQEQGVAFRLLDDDGERYYGGFVVLGADDSGFEPLDDFGTPNAGCTEIQYKSKGKWATL